MKKQRTIWSNDLSVKDYQLWLGEYKDNMYELGIIEKGSDEYNNLTIYDNNFNEWLNDYLDLTINDERMNLDIKLSTPIIAFADLGLWNGRVSGYKVFNSCNVKDTLYSDCDYIKWYVDQYDYKATMAHHDGTNYIVYRQVKDYKYLELLEEKAYNGTLTKKHITRYTKSLKNIINEVYGF